MEAGVYGFGVGSSISAAPIIDFALDIVEVEGKPAAKRGKLGGKKQVWRCWKCMIDKVSPFNMKKPKCPNCGALKTPHSVCQKCGYYKGELVVPIKEKGKKE